MVEVLPGTRTFECFPNILGAQLVNIGARKIMIYLVRNLKCIENTENAILQNFSRAFLACTIPVIERASYPMISMIDWM